MRDVIQGVLAAEAEAKAVLQKAQQEADELVQTSRNAALALTERNLAEVAAEAERILAEAEQQTAAQEQEQLAGIGQALQKELKLDAEEREQALRLVVAAVLGQRE
ncbi:MAG: hypothetical protein GX174_12855 [Lentisphaerae bacterium]|jgi:F0F1-type ATP synthase membrane subunit b/b'|nr:hypothetical protein [Lentisphaerota bacterium]